MRFWVICLILSASSGYFYPSYSIAASSDKIIELLEGYQNKKETNIDKPDNTSSIVSPGKRSTPIEELPTDLDALDEEVALFKELFIVTGTKQKRNILESPFTTFVLDRERIQALAASDISDLFVAIPGLDIYRVNDRITAAGPPGFATEIANQYVVLIDGIPFPTKRGGGVDFWSLPIQVDQIERIEYLPGPQTALYGPYAATGVVNIITRRVSPEKWDKNRPSSVRIRGGGNLYAQYEATYNVKEDSLSTTVWGSYRDSDGYGDPVDAATGLPVPTFANDEASSNRKMGLSLLKDLGNARSLRYDFSYLTGDRTPVVPMTEGEISEHRQHINSVLTYEEAPSPDNTFTLTIKNFNENIDFTNAATAYYTPLTNQNEYEDFRIELRKQIKDQNGNRFTFGGDYEHIFTAGADYGEETHDLYESSLSTLAEFPLRTDSSLFVGLNHYHSSQMGDNFTWKLLVRKQVTKREVFRAGYGTSVRGPDLLGLFITDFTATIPNPTPPPAAITRTLLSSNENLDVEEFEFAELGYERRTTRSSVQSRLFFGHSDNMISMRSTGGAPIDLTPFGGPLLVPLQLFNDPNGNELYGLTTAWDLQLTSRWRSLLTWRYLHTEKEDGTAVRYSPKNHINLTLTYRPTKRCSVNATSRTYSSYSVSENALVAGRPVDGYTVIDFAFTHKLGRNNSQSAWLKVTNVTDRTIIEAYPSATLPPSPGWYTGRHVVAGYGFRF